MSDSFSSVMIYHNDVGHKAYDIEWQKERWHIGEPNSAGGLSYKFDIKNNTGKDIKYVTIVLSVSNAVGDKVSDNISGKSLFSLKLTGPIRAFSTQKDVLFENFMYNNIAKSAHIETVNIEYMDGTKEEVNLVAMHSSAANEYHREAERISKEIAKNQTETRVGCFIIVVIITALIIFLWPYWGSYFQYMLE